MTLQKPFNTSIVERSFGKNVAETADRKYEVVSIRDNSYKTPTTMVAVAKVKNRGGI